MTGSPIVPRPDYAIQTNPLGADFGTAIDSAGCDLLQQAGEAAFTTGIGMFAWGLAKPAAIAAGAGALMTYAHRIGCPYGIGGSGPGGGLYCDVDTSGVCLEWDQGEGDLYQLYDGIEVSAGGNYVKLLSIGCDKSFDDEPDSKGYLASYRDVALQLIDGTVYNSEQILYYKPGGVPKLYSKPLYPDDPNVPDGQCTAKPRVEPWEGVNANNCEMTISVKGWGQTPGGSVAPIMLMEPGHQRQKYLDEEQWKEPDRGPISDDRPYDFSNTCNFQPMLVFPDPDGPPIFIDYDDNYDLLENIRRLGQDLERRFDEQDDNISDINDKLDELLDREEPEPPGEPINIPSGKVTFTAICDTDESGNLEKVEYPLLPAATPNAALVALYDNQTTIMTMLQQHLNWKTPICGPEKPELKGEFRTISFISDETSPYGKSRLRKRLRYRSMSGLGLGEVIDHWKDFTYAAGPVCVIHKGSSSGTPQVWAASESEGKRVIQHALGEAGIDPNQVGEWIVSSSDSARCGVPGTMRVNKKGGFYWITSRDGSDNRPIVGTSPDP